MDQSNNFLIWLAIANLEEGHFNFFLDLKVDEKVVGGQSGYYFSST